MPKRFTDTNKYKKTFIRGLKGPYKLLWDYLYHDCDHAGIWIVSFDVAQLYLGDDMIVNKEDALKYFNEEEQRIIEFDNGKKWFIPSFIEFQYGPLNPKNRAHNSVILILKKYGLWEDDKGLITPLEGCKDKDKDIINSFIEYESINNTKYLETIYLNNIKSKNLKISFEKFMKLKDEFVNTQKDSQKKHKNETDYLNHFLSWLKIQINKKENWDQSRPLSF